LVQDERGHVDIQTVGVDQIKQQVIENLKQVYDPEIPVNIYDLGLIYNIDIIDSECKITMSLTSPFCPAADQIVSDVFYGSVSVHGVSNADIDITFDPQWGPEMMSDEAKILLGIY
jgi:metal-sulfur cluster biosynthetic enzyme